jgi:hypothetical protein
MKSGKHLRWFVLFLAPILGGACIAEAAGPIQSPQFVVVTNTGEPTRSDQQPPDQASTPDLTRTPTVLTVTMTAGQDLSCVTGPDWKLYEWVTRIHEGETATLIARAVPEIPDYYVAHTNGGKECWAFGGSSVISGPVETLPVRETPPPPTVSFVVRNRVYIDLADVYIRPAGDSSWGADRLSANILIDGETAISITAGYYDVLVNDSYGSSLYEAYNRAIGADDTYRILEVATDVGFKIQNAGPDDICKVKILRWDLSLAGAEWEKLYDSADGEGPIHFGEQRDVSARAGLYRWGSWDCSDSGGHFTVPLHVFPGMGITMV